MAKYERIGLVGYGGFANVYEVKNKNGQKSAIKIITYDPGDGEMDIILKEIDILINLSHINIVTLHGFRIIKKTNNDYFNIPSPLAEPCKNYLALRMELCDCDLDSELSKRHSTCINDQWNRDIFKQIIDGVTYLHLKKIILLDLNPKSILLKSETVKITDFGISKRGDTSNMGTPVYVAPEVESGIYNKLVDIFSLGIILIELYTDSTVFEEWRTNTNRINYRPDLPKMSSHGQKYHLLIQNMTSKAQLRPSLKKLKASF